MPKFVGFVFKALILTIVVIVFVQLAAVTIDVFTTTQRIQTICQTVELDIAQNNCMLYDTYGALRQELFDISEKSEYMAVCTGGATGGVAVPGHYMAAAKNGAPTVCLYEKTDTEPASNAAWQRYIQTTTTKITGVVWDSTSSTTPPSGVRFAVAPYGTVLTLRVNTVIQPRLFNIGNFNSYDDLNNGNAWLTPTISVHLDFNVPALTYLK